MSRPEYLSSQKPEEYSKENLYGKDGAGRYSIKGLKNDDPNWLDKAIEKTHPAKGDDYVELDSGILTVNQINAFMKAMHAELSFVDDNDQLVYFNHYLKPDEMKSKRDPKYLGNSLGEVHTNSPRAHRNVQQVINALRLGKVKTVTGPIPWNTRDNFVMAYWRRMEDTDGKYLGVNELVLDIYPIIKYYLKTTGQKLVDDPDATSGATYRGDKNAVDARTSASETDNKTAEKEAKDLGILDQFTDASSGASRSDATSGASQK